MGVYNITKNIEQWNINSTYDVGVMVEYNGSTYQALQKVPVGINIGYNEYWKELTIEGDMETLEENIETLEDDVEELNDAFSNLTNITYDEDEKIVGTWIDDAPIYQLRLTFTVATAATKTIYPVIDLTEYDINAIVKIEGTYHIVRTGIEPELDLWTGDCEMVSILYNFYGDKKLEIRQAVSGDTSVTGYVTLWYTKEESEG